MIMMSPVRTRPSVPVPARPQLSLQILGPLRVWRDGVELDAGPRQRAYLLAVLLAHAGRPVSASELIDLLWDDDVPTSAMNIVHKYVGALRRLLEPELPARGASSYLRRHGNGYLFSAAPGTVDVALFTELVATARAERQPDAALDLYARALRLWRGPAGDGLIHGPTAMPVFTALDDGFFDACVTATTLAVSRGRPERVLRPVRLAASMAPLHEAVQAALVTVLGASGRQAEALSVFRTVRGRLAVDLGVDPGPALQAAHRGVLTRSAAYDGVLARAVPETSGLVGRAGQIAVLRRAVGAAFAGGPGLVVVEGEPGIGKTRVLEETAGAAARRGALIAWGRCMPGEGTPALWPWTQAVRALNGDAEPVETRNGAARFRLFERIVARVGAAAATRPVVVLIDDLQWADAASWELFGHLAARLPAGTALIGALRDRAPATAPDLARMLAAASRLTVHRRIRLRPLSPTEVATLVPHTDPGLIAAIHARTGGNPFLLRELIAHGGAPAEVPSTVRDVVRDRTADLDDDTAELLRVAAFIGRDVNLALLARAAGIDGQTCLDRLEALEALGLLEPTDPFSVRFRHDLVRESVVAATPQRRVAGLHLRVADALGPTDIDRRAHHLWAAGPLAEERLRAASAGG
jgi:DNA-binding SARP family transcriptional activator